MDGGMERPAGDNVHLCLKSLLLRLVATERLNRKREITDRCLMMPNPR